MLVEEQLADFAGSDAHSIYHRPPEIANSADYILRSSDRDYAEALLYENARRLLFGEGACLK